MQVEQVVAEHVPAQQCPLQHCVAVLQVVPVAWHEPPSGSAPLLLALPPVPPVPVVVVVLLVLAVVELVEDVVPVPIPPVPVVVVVVAVVPLVLLHAAARITAAPQRPAIRRICMNEWFHAHAAPDKRGATSPVRPASPPARVGRWATPWSSSSVCSTVRSATT